MISRKGWKKHFKIKTKVVIVQVEPHKCSQRKRKDKRKKNQPKRSTEFIWPRAPNKYDKIKRNMDKLKKDVKNKKVRSKNGEIKRNFTNNYKKHEKLETDNVISYRIVVKCNNKVKVTS
jgi:hypothetical protein